jgi:hypothetical protein
MSQDVELAEDRLKEIFVAEWLKTGDPFKAGLATFPTDSGRAMRVSWDWPKDPEVLDYRAQLIADAEREETVAGLPTKHQLAKEVYQYAATLFDPEQKLSGYKLTAQILGYIERPSTVNIDNRSVTVNKVMAYKDHGDDGAWESKLVENQRFLEATATGS